MMNGSAGMAKMFVNTRQRKDVEVYGDMSSGKVLRHAKCRRARVDSKLLVQNDAAQFRI